MTYDSNHGFASRALALFRALVREDGGQDLIEYAYLAAFIAIAGYVTLNSLVPAVGNAYSTWTGDAGAPSLWQPAEPWSATSAS